MRTLVAVVGVLALGIPAVSQGPSGAFVPVAVWYGGGAARPPHVPTNPGPERARWRSDLETIRSAGFNSVRNWMAWADAEPVKGKYRFNALDQMLGLARDAGLRVILQAFIGTAPAWIPDRYPNAVRLPGGGYCLDHPGVREDMRAFVAATAARAASSPAFFALDIADVPPSPSGARAGSEPAFCVCPHSLARFREWLQRRYITIDGLRTAWHSSVADWSQIHPPNAVSASLAAVLDWHAFNLSKGADDLQFAAAASSARGPHAVGSHSNVPSMIASPTHQAGISEEWSAAGVDYFGTSVFPLSIESSWSPLQLTASLDGIRSARRDRGWWLAALQAAQASSGDRVGPPVSAADVRYWSWTALSRGARALSYFSWFPMGGDPVAHAFGLASLDGSLSDRARSAGGIAGLISRNPALFAPLRPRSGRVAIVYNPIGRVAAAEDAPESLLGIYRALFERNIAVDFVHPDEIAAGRAGAYRAVFLPRPLLLQKPAAAALQAYVGAGGTLISEARPGFLDERGNESGVVPGHGLHEVFGAREKHLRVGGDIAMTFERELDGPLSRLAGKTIVGADVAEHLELNGANLRVIARFAGAGATPGDPAIVLSRYGSGRAILVGTFAGAAFARDPAAARDTGNLLAALASLAGATPEVRLSGGDGQVETRFLESADTIVLIGINHSTEPQKVTMTFTADTPEAIWLNLETGASVNFVAGPDGPTYTYAFKPRDVMVLMIKKEWR